MKLETRKTNRNNSDCKKTNSKSLDTIAEKSIFTTSTSHAITCVHAYEQTFQLKKWIHQIKFATKSWKINQMQEPQPRNRFSGFA